MKQTTAMEQKKLEILSSAEVLQLAEILGKLFSDPEASISPEAEALALKALQGPLLYWFSIQRGVPVSEEVHRMFESASALQMVHDFALKKLYRRLEQEKIPFVPIKGIDLGFRIFPVAALRLFNDWDIWIREADHERFRALLKEDGWECPSDVCGTHHWGDWTKGRFLLEPHFTLPNFPGIPEQELFELAEPSPDSEVRRLLPGSLNLILQFQHCIQEMSHKPRTVKLLLDMEFLLRSGTVDWRWISDFVGKWHLPHPGLMLAAFPEFFRDRWQTGVIFPPEAVSALRERLLAPAAITLEQRRFTVVAEGTFRFDRLLARLNGFSRKSLRCNYPQMGSGLLSYFRFLGLDLFRKICILRHLGTPEVRTIRQQKKWIEGSWQYAKTAAPAPALSRHEKTKGHL